jgi:pimeloyl-ACP methyl ester carboxylesterase
VVGLEFVRERERRGAGGEGEVVLVGHSSGGGLCQGILTQGKIRVEGLVLVAAVPGPGS